jgi:predicted Zn-dependent protease
MQRLRIKPVFIMNQEGLSELEKKAILDGARELRSIAGVEGLIEIKDLGVWRNRDHVNPDGSLKRYQSVEWYIQRGKGKNNKTGQLKTELILNDLELEPWRDTQDHYDLLICHRDVTSLYFDVAFLVGQGRPDIGAVISTNRFRNSQLSDRELYECLKTAAIHELGHVFRLPGQGKNTYRSAGNDIENDHCTNVCVMRQGNHVPSDWVRISRDRLKNGALCRECSRNLKKYFRK